MAVIRLGYVHVKVSDLAAARTYYGETLGLDFMGEEPDGPNRKMYFKGWDEWDHHSLVLEEGGSGLVKLGYKCDSDEDIGAIEARAERFGVTTGRMSANENLGIGAGLRIILPSDHSLELYVDAEYVGSETGILNPAPRPRHPRGASAPRIDHAVITADDPGLVDRFFQEVLEFTTTERVITDPQDATTVASFLRCSDTPHDFAVLKGPNGKLHHFAFLLPNTQSIIDAGLVLGMDDVPVDVGPNQHGITRGMTIYFFDPAGNRNEVFAGGYTPYRDFPTITWTADEIAKGIFYISRELSERFMTVVS